MTLTPSHIIEYLFCPRFTFFEHVLTIPQYEEKNYKALRGRNVHDEKLERNKDYLRKRIGVKAKYADQYLTNGLLRGRVDEVLELQDGTMAPLDYKFAEYKERIFETYSTQLYCYAWLIEENFRRKVKKGFLVYTRSRNKILEVPISAKDTDRVKSAAEKIRVIIDRNYYPGATRYKRRCLNCTYKNICIR